MAFNFDSGQFNKETTPERIGNYQVPRWGPTRARPLEYRPDPTPICDMNGHFLPGAPRGSSKCFGHFKSSWDLPKKITRAVAAELAKEPPDGRFPDWINLRVQRPKVAEQARLRVAQRGKKKKKESEQPPQDPATFQETNGNRDLPIESQEAYDQHEAPEESQPKTPEHDPLGLQDEKEPVDPGGNKPYIPGSLTDPDKRHDSYDRLVKEAVERIHGPQEDKQQKFWRKVAENAIINEETIKKDMKDKSESKTPKLPQVNVTQNFQFAKRMHVGNLEHQPLPDTLGYRNLTKIGEHRDSDINVKPYAIGWKGYGASGPTCCTKMRVHRPKTCDHKRSDGDKDGKRPSTSCPDLGAQYMKPLSLMDLAICWDFRPGDPKSEPKPPKHIDGSNGSKAPAVFTMVHTKVVDTAEEGVSHSNPIFNQNNLPTGNIDVGKHPVPYFEKDMSKEKRKNHCEVQYCPQHNSNQGKTSKPASRRSSASNGKPPCDGIHGCGTPPSEISSKMSREDTRPDKLQPIKQAWAANNNSKTKYDVNRNRTSLESYDKTSLAQGKLHQSSPNDSQTSRSSNKESDSTNSNSKHKTCLSCNGTKIVHEPKHKDDYKFAFKAGNPNSVQSGSTTDSKGVKIPKMRHPYSKKSYSIPTLAPPFSIWRDANASGYPEHWRLASVYQHAYKPIDQRRKALINSVYQ